MREKDGGNTGRWQKQILVIVEKRKNTNGKSKYFKT